MDGQTPTEDLKTPATTVAEQLHHGRINLQPDRHRESPRLLLDLDRCSNGECGECEAVCSYFFHPENKGVLSLRELATYHLVCRRCEFPHCVDACPKDALEQQVGRGRLLVRHTARCVSCHSCSHACPYGTILPELLPLFIGNCDFCLNHSNGPEPLCVSTCSRGALRLLAESEELGEDTFMVGDHLSVHSRHWRREKA